MFLNFRLYTDQQFIQCLQKFKKMLRSTGSKLPTSNHEVWSKMSQHMIKVSGTKNVITSEVIRKNIFDNKCSAHAILGILCEETDDNKRNFVFVPEKATNTDDLLLEQNSAPNKITAKRPSSEQENSDANIANLLLKIKEYESDGDWFFCKSISKMMKDFPADVKNNLKFEILQLTMKRQIEQMNKD